MRWESISFNYEAMNEYLSSLGTKRKHATLSSESWREKNTEIFQKKNTSNFAIVVRCLGLMGRQRNHSLVLTSHGYELDFALMMISIDFEKKIALQMQW